MGPVCMCKRSPPGHMLAAGMLQSHCATPGRRLQHCASFSFSFCLSVSSSHTLTLHLSASESPPPFLHFHPSSYASPEWSPVSFIASIMSLSFLCSPLFSRRPHLTPPLPQRLWVFLLTKAALSLFIWACLFALPCTLVSHGYSFFSQSSCLPLIFIPSVVSRIPFLTQPLFLSFSSLPCLPSSFTLACLPCFDSLSLPPSQSVLACLSNQAQTLIWTLTESSIKVIFICGGCWSTTRIELLCYLKGHSIFLFHEKLCVWDGIFKA